MVCRAVCRCCGWVCAILAVFVGLLCIPAVMKMYWRTTELYMLPDEISMEPTLPVAYLPFFLLGQLPWVLQKGPTFPETFMASGEIPGVSGAYEGLGLHYTLGQLGGPALIRASHAANKKMYYDKKTDRFANKMVSIDTEKTAAFFAPGVQPTLLSIGTSDPRWWATRDLWTATILQLARDPSEKHNLVFPSVAGLTEASFCKALDGWNVHLSGLLRHGDPTKLMPDELGYLVGFNFFRELFGTEMTKEHMDMMFEWQAVFGLLTQTNLATSAQIERSLHIQKTIEEEVLKGEWSKGFLAEAKKRGMDGPGQLRSLLVSFIIAGFGAPGTGLYSAYVIGQLNSDSQRMVPLYLKDPEAFLLEVVRLNGAGGANSNFHEPEDLKVTLPSGKTVTAKKGVASSTNLLVASWDPEVWGGPSKSMEYASTFSPGRENRYQVISWMSELGDIRKCPNMTGCDAAPRFCPGSEFTQRLTRQVTDFYIKTCGHTTTKDEM